MNVWYDYLYFGELGEIYGRVVCTVHVEVP